jgi:ketosteroid isomerase-like protein
MKRLTLFVAAILGMASSGSAQADIMRDASHAVVPVKAVIGAIKSDNAAAISTLYTDNAVVVDEQAPFEWTGSDAGARWLSASSDWSKWSRRIARFRAVVAEIQVDSSNGSAYVLVAGAFSSTDPSHPVQQHGTLTFTLKELNNSWKISSQVWAESPCSRAAWAQSCTSLFSTKQN